MVLWTKWRQTLDFLPGLAVIERIAKPLSACFVLKFWYLYAAAVSVKPNRAAWIGAHVAPPVFSPRRVSNMARPISSTNRDVTFE